MNLTEICKPTQFTIEEANELIPLFQKLTDTRENEIRKAMSDQRYFLVSGKNIRGKECDVRVGKSMVKWAGKLTRLGAIVYLGDFISLDSGGFYWSWRPGEPKIEYFHYYSETPMSRRPMQTILLGPGQGESK